MKVKVISWNIAGGHPIASLDHFDYSPEDLSYFVNELNNLNPDIICLQESHTKSDLSDSNANKLATILNYDYVMNSPASDSHIEEGYMLSNAIISKIPFKKTNLKFFPNPKFELFWSDGRKATTHEKNLQIVEFENFFVANNQMLPISLFGYKYDDNSLGSDFAQEINKVMQDNIKTPIIWCGDFNYNEPNNIYQTIKNLDLKDSLPDVSTRPTKDDKKKKPDHILFSNEFKLIDSKVIETNTDHYLCYAEFEFSDSMGN